MNIQEFYIAFYQSTWVSTNYTREKNAASWRKFWYLVITSGVNFNKNDLLDLKAWGEESRYHGFFYPEEYHYSVAVADSNISFCIAYETLVGRKPFITKNIKYSSRDGLVRHMYGKTQGRLTLGDRFQWKSYQVEVTCFKDEKNAIIACAYDETKDENGWRINNKPIKRFTITNEDLRKANKG